MPEVECCKCNQTVGFNLGKIEIKEDLSYIVIEAMCISCSTSNYLLYGLVNEEEVNVT